MLLRKNIINNQNNRLWLENLLYPKINQETKNQIKLITSNWCLWVVPLLVEKKLEKQASRILLIDTPIKEQIIRVMKRDKIDFKDAQKIISLQATRKQRISVSDDIILNKKNTKKIHIYIHYFNVLYSYLAKQNNKTKYFKKNHITKFY